MLERLLRPIAPRCRRHVVAAVNIPIAAAAKSRGHSSGKTTVSVVDGDSQSSAIAMPTWR